MARCIRRAGLVLVLALLGAPAVPVSAVAAAPDLPCSTPVLSRPLPGARALAALGSSGLAKAARTNSGEAPGLAGRLADDQTLWLDRCGKQFYVEPTEAGPQAVVGDAAAAAPYPYDQTFSLHSRPGSQRTIYLDFGGATISNTAWNSTIPTFSAPAYDTDGAPGTFSNAERSVVQSVWQRVAEDYAPFDVDVTTQDPGAAAITRSDSTDQVYGTRLLVTDSAGPGDDCGCGGIAYVGVFDAAYAHDYYQPAFVFTPAVSGAKAIGEAAAHEVGHTLGLSHDGTASSGYYLGQGAWAPIMGAGYYHPISQWSRGEYSGANNTEDDLSIIASHGAAFRPDDHGDTAATATPIDPASGSASGVIGRPTDQDWFSFASGGGATTVTVTPAPAGPNLDAALAVRDAAGALLATVNPASSQTSADVAAGLGATVTQTLPAGTYYVAVDGVGQGNPLTTGYSDYGSLGQYTLTVATSPAAPPGITTTSLPRGFVGRAYSAPIAVTGGTAPIAFAATGLPSGLSISSGGVITGTPTAAFSGDVTLTAQDAATAATSTSLPLTITAGPAVTTTTLPPATVGLPYRATLTAAGGTAPYAWHATSTLPGGLTLSSDGALAGTPTAAGSSVVAVQAQDADGSPATASLPLVVRTPVKVATSALPTATRSAWYGARLVATGGSGTYAWSRVSGSLPAGLVLHAAGTISGRPTTTGYYYAGFAVTDSAGRRTTRGFSIRVAARPRVTTAALPAGRRHRSYRTHLAVSGGTPAYRWVVSEGRLPAGLTLTAAGVLRGSPSRRGTWTITVALVDHWRAVAHRSYIVRVR